MCILYILLTLVLCALSQSDNKQLSPPITKCITLPTDMPEIICENPPKEENTTLSPMNFTGENLTITLGSSIEFIGFHVALVDKEGNYLIGLSSNQTYIRVLRVCGNPPVETLTHSMNNNSTDRVIFTLSEMSMTDKDELIIRVVLIYERTSNSNCSWAAYNFTLKSSNATSNESIPAPATVPSTAPTVAPTTVPTVAPSLAPAMVPSTAPTVAPTTVPTVQPTTVPSVEPSVVPSVITIPSVEPSVVPSVAPGVAPAETPALMPAVTPVTVPGVVPSTTPAEAPSTMPAVIPVPAPVVNSPPPK